MVHCTLFQRGSEEIIKIYDVTHVLKEQREPCVTHYNKKRFEERER